jgi:pimeloyl-ACP methyl ester carboxylesterase
MTDLPSFKINIPDTEINEMRLRLRQTRWASDPGNETMEYYGISTEYLKDMVDYWVNEFDWRAVEAKINQFNQHRVAIDGVPIHYIYERSKNPDAIPLLLSHGWPWTFWDWRKVIGPLTDPAAYGGDPADSFHVVVPSLPGFCFSNPFPDIDMNHWKMADLFQKLMTETLGFEKYAAGGADYGALISSCLGHKYAKSLYGIQIGHELIPPMFQDDRFWDVTSGMTPTGLPPEVYAQVLKFNDTYASHVAVHQLDGQTLTHGLNDSPAGMLAWLLKRWKKWSDQSVDFATAFPKEHIMTNATLFWVTQSIGPSIRIYRNANRFPWKPSHGRQPQIEAPTGFTFFLGDVFPPGATMENRVDIFKSGPAGPWFNTVFTNVHEKGGHFTPWENPDAVIADLRAMFRNRRN